MSKPVALILAVALAGFQSCSAASPDRHYVVVVGVGKAAASLYSEREGREPDAVASSIAQALSLVAERVPCSLGVVREVVIAEATIRLTEPVHVDGTMIRDCGLTIRSVKGLQVRLTGSDALATHLKPGVRYSELTPAARDHVVLFDLANDRPTACKMSPSRGMYWIPEPVAIEVFEDGERLTNARWPNTEFAALSLGATKLGPNQFLISPDLARKWSGEKAMRGQGYWSFDYSFEDHPLKFVDAPTGVMQLVASDRKYALTAGQRYFLSNMLAELDAPGEWYVDPDACLLYIWPKKVNSRIEVSRAEHAIVVDHAKNIEIQDLAVDMTRGDGIVVSESQKVVLKNLDVTNTALQGVVIDGGDHDRIEGSRLAYTGSGGASLSGGDRNLLIASSHAVTNSRFYRTSETMQTGVAAVNLNGVGQVVSGSVFTNLPHNAIKYMGNEHQIENNLFRDTVRMTADAGIIYTGRDWTSQGTIIRNNVFLGGQDAYRRLTRGIYIDDQSGGQVITGNIFMCVKDAVFLGGGSGNKVASNIFIQSPPGIALDNRGQNWQKFTFDSPKATLRVRLDALPKDTALFAKYPTLSRMMAMRGQPFANVITQNVVVGNGKSADYYQGADKTNTISASEARDLRTVWTGKGDFCGALWNDPDFPVDKIREKLMRAGSIQ